MPADATDVDVVYASRERQPPILFPWDYDPLWGDLDTDVPICWQSAQVGQIRTREDYYYEELRGSSLRVLL